MVSITPTTQPQSKALIEEAYTLGFPPNNPVIKNANLERLGVIIVRLATSASSLIPAISLAQDIFKRREITILPSNPNNDPNLECLAFLEQNVLCSLRDLGRFAEALNLADRAGISGNSPVVKDLQTLQILLTTSQPPNSLALEIWQRISPPCSIESAEDRPLRLRTDPTIQLLITHLLKQKEGCSEAFNMFKRIFAPLPDDSSIINEHKKHLYSWVLQACMVHNHWLLAREIISCIPDRNLQVWYLENHPQLKNPVLEEENREWIERAHLPEEQLKTLRQIASRLSLPEHETALCNIAVALARLGFIGEAIDTIHSDPEMLLEVIKLLRDGGYFLLALEIAKQTPSGPERDSLIKDIQIATAVLTQGNPETIFHELERRISDPTKFPQFFDIKQLNEDRLIFFLLSSLINMGGCEAALEIVQKACLRCEDPLSEAAQASQSYHFAWISGACIKQKKWELAKHVISLIPNEKTHEACQENYFNRLELFQKAVIQVPVKEILMKMLAD